MYIIFIKSPKKFVKMLFPKLRQPEKTLLKMAFIDMIWLLYMYCKWHQNTVCSKNSAAPWMGGGTNFTPPSHQPSAQRKHNFLVASVTERVWTLGPHFVPTPTSLFVIKPAQYWLIIEKKSAF